MLKFIIYISLLFFALNLNAAKYSAKIFSNESDKDTIDMGLCYYLDSLKTQIFVENDGDNPIFLGTGSPWQVFGRTDKDPNGFLKYNPSEIKTNIFIAKNTQAYKIQFLGYSIPLDQNYGRKEAKLSLRLDVSETNDSIVNARDFFFIARNTNLWIDSYDDLDFDSVMISSPVPYIKPIYIKNVYMEPLDLESDELKLLTSNIFEEFIPQDKINFPLKTIPKSNAIELRFAYIPKNLGYDSAEYKMTFKPLKYANPKNLDSTVTFSTKVKGIGVKQELSINKILSKFTYTYNPDTKQFTIELGELQSGVKENIQAVLINSGNIPINILNQTFRNTNANILILSQALKSNKQLNRNSIDTFKIEITPFGFGPFENEFVIQTDILKRNIFGVQNTDEKIVIKIRGYVSQPKLAVLSDTVDFGGVGNSSLCSSYSVRNLELKNLGNATLNINNIEIKPNSDFEFDYQIDKLFIEKNNSANIEVTFNPKKQISYNSELIIHTNEPAPNDRKIIHLKGIGLPQLNAEIIIDTIKASAGRKIKIPLKMNGQKLSLASNFSDDLYFNNSVLEFIGFESDGTASEGLSISSLIEIDKQTGALKLDLSRQSGDNFLNRDTLINLIFNTYIGNSSSTSLILNRPKFSDENCEFVLEPNLSKGVFILDSICGLEYKAYPISNGKFAIINVSPNPVDNFFNLQVEIAFKTHIQITIYDSYANKVKEIVNDEMPQGIYNIYTNSEDLTNGNYYIQMNINNMFIYTKSLIKLK